MQIRRMFFISMCCWASWAVAFEVPDETQRSAASNSEAGNPLTNAAGDASQRKLVTLAVDYGDGFQKRFTSLSWRQGMTVLDVMSAARRHKRGRLEFEQRGRAATALLTRIDDVTNEGGGGRNWIYYINRQKADRGFAIMAVKPGDEVLWRFEVYQ